MYALVLNGVLGQHFEVQAFQMTLGTRWYKCLSTSSGSNRVRWDLQAKNGNQSVGLYAILIQNTKPETNLLCSFLQGLTLLSHSRSLCPEGVIVRKGAQASVGPAA